MEVVDGWGQMRVKFNLLLWDLCFAMFIWYLIHLDTNETGRIGSDIWTAGGILLNSCVNFSFTKKQIEMFLVGPRGVSIFKCTDTSDL